MKNKRFLFGLVGGAGLLLGAGVAENHIEWTWGFRPVYELKCEGSSLQFGLRSDGVVIWRNIAPATTNSPGEAVSYSNLWLTQPTYTNSVLYFSK